MGLFRKKKPEIREDTSFNTDATLLQALLGKSDITKDKVMNIPGIAACINLIADTVSSLKIKLYKKDEDKIVEVPDDKRVYLLNEDTGDTYQ